MNKNDIFLAFEEIDDDILERSETAVTCRKALSFRKWGVLVACMVLMVSMAVVAVAVENKEYNNAVEFFNDNGLSMSGLSRSDVKAVYRDITTKRFTYGKTAEVIERRVYGLEIDQKVLTPEELANLWDKYVWANTKEEHGVHYKIQYQWKMNENTGFENLYKNILECYQDDKLLWTVEFDEKYEIEDAIYTSNGTVVVGNDDARYNLIARLDESGNILWQKEIEHGFKKEVFIHILDNGDGTWTVIGFGESYDNKGYLCLSKYDIDGNELIFRENEIDEQDFSFYGWKTIRLGDGYLVRISTTHIAKLDRDGILMDSFTYEGEYCDYRIVDMVEFGGKIYLSAYTIPKFTDKGTVSWDSFELGDVFQELLDYLDDENLDMASLDGKDMTDKFRNIYTAVLLRCDADGGEPETFYAAKGSLSAELSINDDGELVWYTESIMNVYFSASTSSFTFGGKSLRYRYTFDESGNLLSQEDTGEITPFYK